MWAVGGMLGILSNHLIVMMAEAGEEASLAVLGQPWPAHESEPWTLADLGNSDGF